MLLLSILLFMLAAIGIVLVGAQSYYVRRFLRRAPLAPRQPLPGISVLKPLCGIDQGLEENLLSFAQLDFPEYEVLLGVKSGDDAAVPLARSMVSRFPHRFRLVFQRGEPGLNPKVNQLITLEKAARFDIVVVSDASVRVDNGFLPEIAAHLENPDVALVTHPVVGSGERDLGAFCDNERITTHVSAGPIATKELAGQDIVLGKSMAFRKADLKALGGFESMKDYLAEDFILGRRVGQVLRKRVVIARNIPLTITVNRTARAYVERFGRWAILQRHAAGMVMFSLQNLVNPIVLGTLALLCAPSMKGLAVLGVISASKSALDVYQMHLMRPEGVRWWAFFLIPYCDLMNARAWFYGLRYDRVEWRGNVLQVTSGTRLVQLRRAPQETGDGDSPLPTPTPGASGGLARSR
jgi:ceramide glucosyltransferase